VAGDKFGFAMPEVGIGFFPDIGATWFLPRLPGELGTYCALTGERLGAGDGGAAGVATCRVASARFPDLGQALCPAVAVDAALGAFAQPVAAGPAMRGRGAFDRWFCHDQVEEVLQALDAAIAESGTGADLARAAASAVRTKSPTSLKIAL